MTGGLLLVDLDACTWCGVVEATEPVPCDPAIRACGVCLASHLTDCPSEAASTDVRADGGVVELPHPHGGL